MGNSSDDDKDKFYDFNDPAGFFPGNPAKKPTPPAPPDYIGAAREQGQQNIALAKVNATLNNPNIKNAMGQQKVTFDANGIPTIDQTLNPTAQGIFDTSQDTASTLAGQFQDNVSQPLDYSNVEGLTGQATDAILSRLEPNFQRDEDALRTRLANQGITAQSNEEAFGKDMRTFNNAKTDARLQAVLSGLQYGPSLLQQDIAIRDQPLNEFQQLTTGVKSSLPQFQPFSGSANAQAGDYQGAVKNLGQYETDIFNYNNAQNEKQRSGLMSAAAMAAMAFSDRRLKSNIVKVGDDARGFGWYEYEIFGVRRVGVMADEVERVMPQAVGEVAGFKTVDYAMLGG